jgi:dimethylhistidine N-methyltransferase
MPENPEDSKDGYRILTAAEIESQPRMSDFAVDMLMGLSEHPKRLSSRHIYDDEGSRLFSAICDLEEYYPTRCEAEIFEKNKNAILELVGGKPMNLVDLGAGDGRKTRILVDHFLEKGVDFRYVPIDISEGAMRACVGAFKKERENLTVEGLVSEYFEGISWLGATEPQRTNLVLFLGSNIGNFNKAQARTMLRQLWNASKHGDTLLIGFDLKKDIDLLLNAYNDKAGITASFNKNLLARANRELGANFRLDAFRHFATYNVFSGAMESYLVSLEAQTVAIDALKTSFSFKPWEPIHTEYSYKYLLTDIEDLALSTGYSIAAQFFDEKRWFVDSVWRVKKG